MVSVPRINFMCHVGTHGITFKRRQFPVELGYALTFHKSQGQTLDHVGIDLRGQPFSHGMSYVAVSRARRAATITFLSLQQPPAIRNITYSRLVAEATNKPLAGIIATKLVCHHDPSPLSDDTEQAQDMDTTTDEQPLEPEELDAAWQELGDIFSGHDNLQSEITETSEEATGLDEDSVEHGNAMDES